MRLTRLIRKTENAKLTMAGTADIPVTLSFSITLNASPACLFQKSSSQSTSDLISQPTHSSFLTHLKFVRDDQFSSVQCRASENRHGRHVEQGDDEQRHGLRVLGAKRHRGNRHSGPHWR